MEPLQPRKKDAKAEGRGTETPAERFKGLAKKLIRVPPQEIEKARERFEARRSMTKANKNDES